MPSPLPAQVTDSTDTVGALRQCVLFRDFADDDLAAIAPLATERVLAAGAVVVREGEPARELFIVQRGRVEVTKRAPGATTDHRLTTLCAGDSVGEMAVVDRAPRSASIRALEPTTLVVLDMDALDGVTLPHPALRARMLQNLTVFLGRRLRDVSEVGVTALEHELELARTRVAMGTFLTYVFLMMVGYSFALRMILDASQNVADSTIVSVPVILGFAVPLWIMMRRSGEPATTYGLTWRNAAPAFRDGILWSIPILAAAALLKLAITARTPALAAQPLFTFGGLLDPSAPPGAARFAFLMSLAYLLVVPIQEFIARGALQGPLERFFVGPRATVRALVIANLLFMTSHLYLSTAFALITLIPGFLWGALYARHRTLVAPITSHALIGWWTLFVLGFDRILA
jgi:CRP-like cAMP-binding protein